MISSNTILPLLILGSLYFLTNKSNNSKLNSKQIGYINGKPFDLFVTYINNKPIEINTAKIYKQMYEDAKKENIILKIESGFRTNEEQIYFYNCYINCNCNNCNFAKKPGFSDHQNGKALDINITNKSTLSWLENNASKFGFIQTIKSEPWHFELT